jgi:guanylate kinase
MAKRLIILSGPSCAGKGPLVIALGRFYPKIEYNSIPAMKRKESRGGRPRPDEVNVWNNPDYFRTKDEIEWLRSEPQYICGKLSRFATSC